MGDLDAAEVAHPGAERDEVVFGDDRDVDLGAGLGVLVTVVGLDQHGLVGVEVEPLDAPLPTAMQVGGTRVRNLEDAGVVGGPDERAVARYEAILD